MYEMDRVHKIATKNKVTEFYGEYKWLRNQVTDMINATEKEYYEHINTSSKNIPRMWGEIKWTWTNEPKDHQRLYNLTHQSFEGFVVRMGREFT